MNTALFIGRFQPFHLGHLSVVQEALTRHDHLIIGIGSAQYAHTRDNPYSYEDRATMIRATLDEAGIEPSRTPICALPDIHDNARWVNHVRQLIPPFDVALTGSDHVRRLFEQDGHTPVEPIKFLKNISATRIRKAMANNEEWEQWVPKAVFTHLATHRHAP